MKTKYKIIFFYLSGLKQNPKDLDFDITPSLIFAKANRKEISDLGIAYGIGLKWGFWAVGVKLYGAYLFKEAKPETMKLDKKVNSRIQFRVEFTRDNPGKLATDHIPEYCDWLELKLQETSRKEESDNVSGQLIIDFAVFLSGHDKETIEQMFADWKKHN